MALLYDFLLSEFLMDTDKNFIEFCLKCGIEIQEL